MGYENCSLLGHELFLLLSIFVVYIISMIDIFMTHAIVFKRNELYPNIDNNASELNPFIRFLWSKIGYTNTQIFFLVFNAMLIATLFSLMYNFNAQWFSLFVGFYIGCFFIINLIHLDNYSYLCKEEERKKGRIKLGDKNDTG